MQFLVTCMLMASKLKNQSSLYDAVKYALKLALPNGWAETFIEHVETPGQLPSKSTVQRHRLTLHCAFLLLLREWNSRHSQYAVFLSADSSPQGKRA
eukprot:927494-Pyramimonas_sp.AAC.1